MSARLGVGITYHDERELLTECVRSLLDQKDGPDEILIYDDASRFPASDFVPTDVRVRVIRGEANLGPARGRNVLWRASTADYFHFHDADDWFDAGWSQRVRAEIAEHSPDAVFTEVDSHRDGKPFARKVLGLRALATNPDLLAFSLRHALLTPSGTYRRELLETLGGYREDIWQSEDFDFHVRLAALRPDCRFIDESLIHIRLREQGRSRQQIEVWECRLQALDRFASSLPQSARPDFTEAATEIGAKLFQLGARSSARRAFRLAYLFGTPRFEGRAALHRWVASRVGAESAEWISAAYRLVIPSAVRRLFPRSPKS